MAPRHYLQFRDFSRKEYEHLFERTRWIKAQFKAYQPYQPLADRTLAMIFEKQSTRTRLSFEAGMLVSLLAPLVRAFLAAPRAQSARA